MSAIEKAAFSRGVTAETLMEKAGAAIARAVRDFFPDPRHVVAICGKGHNAGDALVAARHLAEAGWSTTVELSFPEKELVSLAAKKLAELRALPRLKIETRKSQILLDGLLGIGAKGEPREPVAAAIRGLDERRRQGAFVVAVDGPSGLDADTGKPADPCVEADLTVTIGQPKTGLLADAAVNFVGRLAFAPLEELAPTAGDPAELITPELLRPLLAPRPFDSHKGRWGRVGVIAGSRGYLGAARLCAEAALRAGAGLVTLYARPDSYELLAVAMPPEIMAKPVASFASAADDHLDAIAVGPGLGESADADVRELVVRFAGPMVVDADALNDFSRHPDSWREMAGPRLFTPHPGEMARLFPEARDWSRRETAEKFAARHQLTVLLKGARTVIAAPGRPTAFNTTGNPGMGTGGMGDVLTGVCAASLAQGRSPREAAMLGSWICGRAAERYVFGPSGSPESLVAREVIGRLGETFRELRDRP